MSVCDPCLQVQTIPVCVTNLAIGDIAAVNTDVFVYIKDLTTDRLTRFDVTSTPAGLVTIVPTIDFMPDHAYELHITLDTALSIEDKELITVDNALAPVDCISMRFIYVEDDKSYTNIRLSA